MKKPKCPYMWAFTSHGSVMPIYCGQWQCEECAVRLARFWAKRVWYGMQVIDEPARFWTLTLPGKVKTSKFGFAILPDMWDSFRKQMQRANDGWTYAAFSEGQPKRKGMPHFHIITYQPIPPKFHRLKDFAVAHGFGYQALDKPVDSKLGAWYVSKYASKGDPTMPKGFRRVRLSQDWPDMPEEEHDEYIVQRKNESLVEYFIRVHHVCNLTLDQVKDKWFERVRPTS